MTDDTRWTPHHRIGPRQPQPAEVLWTLTKGTQSRRAELRDDGKVGAELQMYNDQFVSGRRQENRALAMLDAEAFRDTLLMQHWTCTRCQGERWTCEEHPALPCNHDGCNGAGDPCPVCNAGDAPRPPRGFLSYLPRREADE